MLRTILVFSSLWLVSATVAGVLLYEIGSPLPGLLGMVLTAIGIHTMLMNRRDTDATER